MKDVIIIAVTGLAYFILAFLAAFQSDVALVCIGIVLGTGCLCLAEYGYRARKKPPVAYPGPRGTTTQHPEGLGWPD